MMKKTKRTEKRLFPRLGAKVRRIKGENAI